MSSWNDAIYVLATRNAGKIKELQSMLGRSVIGLNELETKLNLPSKSLGDILEPGLTYESNAGLKAAQIAVAICAAKATERYAVITDDSGFEMCGVFWTAGTDTSIGACDRLQGRPFPGVDTKQFMESHPTELDAFTYGESVYTDYALYEEAAAEVGDDSIPPLDRKIRAVTVLALQLVEPGQVYPVVYFHGVVSGTYQWPPRGSNGFCYDVIFQPDGHSKTFAEMTTEEKCEVSHRQRAIDALKAHSLGV